MGLRVLVFAYRFPPYAGVGGRRWSKLTKYLARAGCELDVVTVPWGDEVNQAMRDVLHPRIHIHRTASLTPRIIVERNPYSFPGTITARLIGVAQRLDRWNLTDDARFWGLSMMPLARKLARNADVMVATGAPFMTHVWAARLATEKGMPPLILEYRDPWNDLPEHRKPQVASERARHMERTALSGAQAVVVVTEGLRRAITRETGGRIEVTTITNGYDPEDFSPEETSSPRALNLIHTGNLYGGRQEPLLAFLDAFEAVHSAEPDLTVRFFGRFPPDIRRRYTTLESAGVLQISDTVEYLKIPSLISEAFACLHFNARHTPGALSTKIFEYAASSRPVLSINYGGDVADLIRRLNIGVSVDADDREGIMRALKNLAAQWRDNPAYTSRPSGLAAFAYPKLAKDWLSLLERIVS